MGVLEARTQHIILLKCYISRGEGEIPNIAKAILALIVKNYLSIELDKDIPELIIDRYEKAFNIKYTIEDLEQKLMDFNLNYIYPLLPAPIIEEDNDSPI